MAIMENISSKGLVLTLLYLALSSECVSAQTKDSAPPIIHNTKINSVAFDARDEFLVTASADGITKLWDVKSGRVIRGFGTKLQTLNPNFQAVLSPNGKLIATINGRGGRVWNTDFGDLAFQLLGYGDTLKAV